MYNVRASVCFVCLGNICRSPTAEGVFRSMAEAAGLASVLHIESAGTAAHHEGERADRRSRVAARTRSYDLRSIARQFDSRDFERFDYILAMDSQNLTDLKSLRRRAPASNARVGMFRDFDESSPRGSQVPDPYYGGDGGFEEVLDQCERACEGLIAHLLRSELSQTSR